MKEQCRSALRYQVAAPVVFSWENPAGGRLQGEGLTRDISVRGAFILILTAECPPTGVTLSVKISLPRLMMATKGRVVRIQHPVLGESRDGFAVACEDFALQKVVSSS